MQTEVQLHQMAWRYALTEFQILEDGLEDPAKVERVWGQILKSMKNSTWGWKGGKGQYDIDGVLWKERGHWIFLIKGEDEWGGWERELRVKDRGQLEKDLRALSDAVGDILEIMSWSDEVLLKHLRERKRVEKRAMLGWILEVERRGLDSGLPYLRQLLLYPDEEIFRTVMGVLGVLRDEGSVEIIEGFLSSGQEWKRILAVEILGEIGGEKARKILERVYKNNPLYWAPYIVPIFMDWGD